MIDWGCSDKTNLKLSIHQEEQGKGISFSAPSLDTDKWDEILAWQHAAVWQQQKQLARYAREPYWLWHLFQLEDKPFSHAILSAIFTDNEFDSCSARSCSTYSHVASQPSLASQIISSSQKKIIVNISPNEGLAYCSRFIQSFNSPIKTYYLISYLPT